MLTKHESSPGRGCPGGEQEGKGIQEGCSAMWLPVLGLMVMVLVSSFSLASHSGSGSFPVVHALLSQDVCQRGFWGGDRHMTSPLDLSQTLLIGVAYYFHVPYWDIL